MDIYTWGDAERAQRRLEAVICGGIVTAMSVAGTGHKRAGGNLRQAAP